MFFLQNFCCCLLLHVYIVLCYHNCSVTIRCSDLLLLYGQYVVGRFATWIRAN